MSPRQNINVCHARCGTLACLVVPNDHRLSEICVIFNDTDLLNLVPSQLGFHDSGHRVVVGSIASGRWWVAGGADDTLIEHHDEVLVLTPVRLGFTVIPGWR